MPCHNDRQDTEIVSLRPRGRQEYSCRPLGRDGGARTCRSPRRHRRQALAPHEQRRPRRHHAARRRPPTRARRDRDRHADLESSTRRRHGPTGSGARRSRLAPSPRQAHLVHRRRNNEGWSTRARSRHARPAPTGDCNRSLDHPDPGTNSSKGCQINLLAAAGPDSRHPTMTLSAS